MFTQYVWQKIGNVTEFLTQYLRVPFDDVVGPFLQKFPSTSPKMISCRGDIYTVLDMPKLIQHLTELLGENEKVPFSQWNEIHQYFGYYLQQIVCFNQELVQNGCKFKLKTIKGQVYCVAITDKDDVKKQQNSFNKNLQLYKEVLCESLQHYINNCLEKTLNVNLKFEGPYSKRKCNKYVVYAKMCNITFDQLIPYYYQHITPPSDEIVTHLRKWFEETTEKDL